MEKRTVTQVKPAPNVGAVLLLPVVATLAMSAWGSCFPPPVGLVGWWPGEGNANDIQGTNDGTLHVGATANAVGMVGQAFGFDGTNGYVQIPDSTALRPANLTIEAWVLFTALDSAGSGSSPVGQQFIVFKQNTRKSSFEGFYLGKERRTTGDILVFRVSSMSGKQIEVDSSPMVAPGVWYHVAGVRSASIIQLYVNGQLEGQNTVNFPQNYGTQPLYFGTSGQSYLDRKFKGLLDEVSLYNRALSAAEVAALYAVGAAGKCKAGNGVSITTQPQDQSVVAGSNALFTVAAAGAAPLSYQWWFSGAPLPGATTTNLLLLQVQPTDAGGYTAVVTNLTSAATSAVAVLTVLLPPVITTQPQSLTTVTGSTASFSATASGSAPLGFQWQLNGVGLANGGRVNGARTNTLSITNVQPSDAGNYTLWVSNAVGVVTSTMAVLTVSGPPVITVQPASESVAVGANASFLLAAAGTEPLAYQWLFGSAPITDATNASLTVTNVQPANAGGYSAVVMNSAGTATSAVAVLSVIVPPVITTQPQSRTNGVGSAATFSATATGSVPLSYQWWFNTSAVAGASASSYTCANVQVADAGSYSVVVSNAAGSTISSNATLTVLAPPAIITPPASQSVAAGTNASFSVAASGTPPLGYQWLFNGTNLGDGGQFSGSTGPTLLIFGLQATNAGGYSVVVTNAVGSVTSTVSSLTVVVPGSCLPSPAGLVGWWPGDGDAGDVVGGDNGTLQGGAIANAAGVVSQAFGFDGTNSYVQIPDSPVFHPTNLTIETWVRFKSLNSAGSGGSPAGDQYLVFKQNTQSGNFEGFDLSKTRVAGGDVFRFLVTSASAQVAEIHSSTVVATGVWYHVAAVRGSNYTQIYVNGNLERQTNVSFLQNYGTLPLYFGTSGQSYWDHKLSGLLDEVSLYNRALSANEVAAIYGAGAAGKCKLVIGPSITTPPQSQSVAAGNPVTFAVAAAGTKPLSYQWQFDGTNLSGATSTSLTLVNVQAVSAGSYAVVVANSAASVTSGVAVLTVLVPSAPWETSDIGAVWSDDFNRASLGSNWVILGGANASITNSELCFVQADQNSARQVYYEPWLTCSSAWTLRWTQRFRTLGGNSLGVGVGIKNFQAAGGDDRGYNALLSGAGTSRGCMQIQRWNGTAQVLASSGPALTLSAGDVVDCSLTRSDWTMTATASNRANAQVCSTSIVFSQATGLIAPSISRACFYPLGGTVYFDDVSFTLNHRKPARFIIIGASSSDGYNATSYSQAFASVVQSNFNEAVCNDSGSWNSTSNSVSILPEILAHQPGTAILLIGDNDLRYGYPAAQWQGQYSALVAQLQANGARVRHCLPTPQNIDVTPLRTWIMNTYPTSDIIDTWTPLVQPGSLTLQPAYDSGDGLHPNDAGHLLIGQIIISNLPPAIRVQPQDLTVVVGDNAGFTVSATGPAALGYEWQFEGANLSGATSRNIILTNVQPADGGSYTVVVSDAAGSVTSAAAVLTVVSGGGGIMLGSAPTFVAARPPTLSYGLTGGDEFQLAIAGQPQQQCVIEMSDDLVHWAALTNVTLLQDGMGCISTPLTASRQFYRAKLLP